MTAVTWTWTRVREGDPEPAPTPARAAASTAGAVVGGGVLVALALPLLVQAVAWSVLDPGEAPWPLLLAMGAVAVGTPVPLAAGIAARARADVRATALLVGVPQAVLFVPLLLLGLWVRP